MHNAHICLMRTYSIINKVVMNNMYSRHCQETTVFAILSPFKSRIIIILYCKPIPPSS